MEDEPPETRLRNYQQEALVKARRTNIVMCGAAGIGKTHVAMSLLREADYSDGKVAFYLATTRHLAEQQWQRICNGTALLTKLCVGMEYDLLSKSQWQTLFRQNQLVVCTPQILLNVLDKGHHYITLQRINLLILDECHKARRNHPYALLMHQYGRGIGKGPLPRVFGMTATPSKNCHQILHCALHVCPQEDVKKFAAKAPLKVIFYKEGNHISWAEQMRWEEQMRKIKEFGAQREFSLSGMTEKGTGIPFKCSKGMDESSYLAISDYSENFVDDGFHENQALQIQFDDDTFKMSSEIGKILKEVKSHLPSMAKNKSLTEKILWRTYNDVGVWFGLRHILLGLEHWIGTVPSSSAERDVEEGVLARKLALYLKEVLPKAVKLRRIRLLDRVEKLIQCLHERWQQDRENFRALVFVQRRTTCRVLYEFLNMWDSFAGLCGFVIGQASASGLTTFGLKRKYKRAIKEFASGKLKILVATDVLSEGIDVPDCSLVVAFDTIANSTAFVQMRGRARQHNGGAFVLFASDQGGLERLFDLEQGAALFEKDVDDMEMSYLERRDMSFAHFFPQFSYAVPATGATITLNNSISLLTQLLQWNKDCVSYQLLPTVEYSERVVSGEGVMFKCLLTLPDVFGLPVFESSFFPAKIIARAVAAYHACIEFHRCGFVDDDFNPVRESLQLEAYEHFIPEFYGSQVVNERLEIKTQAFAHFGVGPVLEHEASAELSTDLSAGSAKTSLEKETQERVNSGTTRVATDAASALGLTLLSGKTDRANHYVYRLSKDAGCVGFITDTLLPESSLRAEDLSSTPAQAEQLSVTEVQLLAQCHVAMLFFVIHGASAFNIEFGPILQIDKGCNSLGKCDETRQTGEKTPPAGGAEKGIDKNNEPCDGSDGLQPDVDCDMASKDKNGRQYPQSCSTDPARGKYEDAREYLIPQTHLEQSRRKWSGRCTGIDEVEGHGKDWFAKCMMPKAAWDKGYVLVPIKPNGEIDWVLVKTLAQSSPSRHLVHGRGDYWPLPSFDAASIHNDLLLTCSPLTGRPKLWGPIQVVEQKTLAEERKARAAQATASARKRNLLEEDKDGTVGNPSVFEMSTAGKNTMPAVDNGLPGNIDQGPRKKLRSGQDRDIISLEREGCSQDEVENGPAVNDVSRGDAVERRAMQSDDLLPHLHLSEYPVEIWDRCDQQQPLILVEKILDSSYRFRALSRDGKFGENDDNEPRSEMQRNTISRRRLVAPQLCTLIRIPRSLYEACQAALPQVWRLEIALKVESLIQSVGIPVKDSSIIREAICKPDYERLEVLGDIYLKWVMTCVVLRKEPYLLRESLLHDFRCNLTCNRRLVRAALQRGLDGHIVLRAKVVNEPYRHWAPSLMAPLAASASEVNVKVIADVVEALIGAYLLDGGPRAADAFLRWLGLPVMCERDVCQQQRSSMPGLSDAPAAFFTAGPPPRDRVKLQKAYWPLLHRCCQCWKEESLANTPQNIHPKAVPKPATDLVLKVTKLENFLGYTFRNKWLALQALTHPSHSQKHRRSEKGQGHTIFISDYQRFEFLGDALLDLMVMVQILYENPDSPPKPLHVEKGVTVSNEHLARRALEWLQLHRFYDSDSIELNRCVETYANDAIAFAQGIDEWNPSKNGSGPKALADVLEALIAAVFIDTAGNIEHLVEIFLPRLRRKSAFEEAEDSRDARAGLAMEMQWKLQVSSIHELTVELREFFPILIGTCRRELALEEDDLCRESLVKELTKSIPVAQGSEEVS